MKRVSIMFSVLFLTLVFLLGCATNETIQNRNVLAAQQATDEYKVYTESINNADSDTARMAIALAFAYRKPPVLQNVVTPLDYMKAGWGVVRDTAQMVIPFVNRGGTESSTTVSAGGDVFMNSSKSDRTSTIRDVEGVTTSMDSPSTDSHQINTNVGE